MKVTLLVIRPVGFMIVIMTRRVHLRCAFEENWNRVPIRLFDPNAKGFLEFPFQFNDFRTVTGTKSAIHVTFVTPYGLVRNSYAGNVQSEITADDLFM